jgi:Na+-transporting methylmalonyl-CoA/oxaloacetate decarboxylase gamma subunit
MQQRPYAHDQPDQDEELWTELISSEMDAWQPHRLPRAFRPRRRMGRLDRRLLTLMAVAVVLAVLALAVFAGVSRGVVSRVVDLGHPEPVKSPSVQPTSVPEPAPDATPAGSGEGVGGVLVARLPGPSRDDSVDAAGA